MFDSILNMLFPAVTFESEIFMFIIYILKSSVSCGLVAYILGMIHDIFRLSVNAPRTKLV